jgi:hypothetical protein
MSTAISPLIAAGSRFSVSTGQPDTDEELSPIHLRSFLLRGAESIHSSPYAEDATPKVTTGYDGTRDDQSEEFNQPDFSP